LSNVEVTGKSPRGQVRYVARMSEAAPDPAASRADTHVAIRVVAWVLGAIDALALAWWVALGVQIGPTFAGMFDDFGGAIPLPTRVVIHPAFGLSVAAVGAGVLAGAVLARLRPAPRAGLLGALLIAHFATSGVVTYLAYLPIFAMADKVR
jgi:hypothetical protein